MTDHIKIGDTSPRVQYATDGLVAAFPYPFPIFRAEDLVVLLDAAVLNAGFEIEGAGASEGGQVGFAVPPAAGHVLTLRRRLAIERVTDFLPGGDLRADSFNDELDRRTAVDQQLAEELGRALRAPEHDRPATLVLPERDARAGRALVFDGDGNVALGDPTAISVPGPYVAPFAGAAARPLAAKLADLVSVKDFGAKGDGVADDGPAFVAALAAASAVFVPPGVYLSSLTIPLGDRQALFGAGDGSEIRATDADRDVVEITGSYAALRDLQLRGGKAGVRLYGKTGPCVQNALADLAIWQAETGIVLDGFEDTDNPCYWNAFDRILVAQPALHGVHLTKSGAGDSPNANKFRQVRVYSLSAPIGGSGFYVEWGSHMNTFNDCEANLSTGAHSCFRFGAQSYKTQVFNLYTETLGVVSNVHLDPGADESVIVNLHSQSAGSAVDDLSGGATMTFNAGFPVKNRLQKTVVDDLEVTFARLHTIKYVTGFFDGTGTYAVDMTRVVNLVSAFAGAVTAVLPLPAAWNGHLVTIKKTDVSGNAVTVEDAAGNDPDGFPTVLAGQNDFVTVISNGAAWWVVGMRF